MANLYAWQKIDYVIPGRPFGDGVDGPITISGDPNTRTTVTGTDTQSTSTLGSAILSNGDLVKLVQTQGTGAGNWQYNMVLSGGGTTSITWSKPLHYTFGTGAQCVRIPRYTTVTVNAHTVTAWDGTLGGIEVICGRDSVTLAQTVTFSGKGFRGNSSAKYAGESYTGAGARGQSANAGAGGGTGDEHKAGGGGAGHKNNGSNGTQQEGGLPGYGGSSYGSDDLLTIFLGSSGGSGISVNPGGNGGSILEVISKSITVSNTVNNDGTQGGGGDINGGNGGGSGGSILLVAITVTLGSNLLTALGATGTSQSGIAPGGDGSIGRIAIHHSGTITGTTNPTFFDVTDTTLAETITQTTTAKASISNPISTPAGIILIWTGTNASIPLDWERVTSLDGKFLKGTANGVDPNTTGGSDTHSHTSPTHTHSMVSHGHAIVTNGDSDSRGNEPGSSVADVGHTHSGTINGLSGGTLNDATSYQSASTLPPYYEVIFITPARDSANVVNGIIAFFGISTTPNGWTFCNGDSSTPDLRNKYLRGAGTGANSGTTGGTLNHAHTVDHGHTAVGHTHSGSSGGNTYNNRSNAGGPSAAGSHSHTIYLDSASTSVNSYTGSAGSGDTVEVSYKKLIPIQSDGTQPSSGLIAIWLGTLATIPAGWILCDGSNVTLDLRGLYPKCSDTTGNVGGIGGANTHTHAASNSHTHTATGTHTHSGSTDTFNANLGVNGDAGVHSSVTHSHTLNSVDSQTASWNNQTISADSASNEPAYRTVAFIQYSFTTATKIVTAKAAIKTIVTRTVTSKARIKRTFPVSINAKSDIKSNVIQTINAKAVVGIVFRIQAKGDIKKFAIPRTIQVKGALQLLQEYSLISKGNIKSIIPQTIQSIGTIFKEGSITEPSFGGITLPFPSEAIIEPLYEVAENTTLKGETRRKVMARKYKYTLGWDTMFVANYNALEAIVNILGDAIFIYEKWPQSITGIDCIASLSSRKLEYGTGDSTYVSSVILTLTEVESRI